MKKLISILVAFAMMAALAVTAAFAEDPPTGTTANSKIEKYLVVPEGVTVPTVTNTFTFANYLDGSSGVTAAELTDAAPATQTIIVNSASNDSLDPNDGNSKVQAETLNSLRNPPHPGVYAYVVTEATSVITNATDAQAIVPGDEAYVIRYYVKNVNGTPTVTDITAQEAEVDPDTGEVTIPQDAEKVDPTDEDPTGDVDPADPEDPDDEDEIVDEDVPGIAFKNIYRKTEGDGSFANAPLKVSKTLAGTGADTTLAFPFTMTLTAGEGAAAGPLVAYVYDTATGNKVQNDQNEDISYSFAYDTATPFELKGGQTLAFPTLPAGTRFEVSETMNNADAYSAYAPSVAVNTTEYTASADLGQSLAGQAANTTYLVAEGDKDVAAYTNTYDASIDTPTGILISNLPYIALALVAIGGLVAYVVVRRRQDDEA